MIREYKNSFDSLFASLNVSQKEAVLHTGSPQIIIAGAGSGKTRVIMVKIAYLCHSLAIDPCRILAVTFTNKAAQELKNRLDVLGFSGVNSGTFHGVCLKILQAHGAYIGIKNPVVYDEQDQASVIKDCLKELKIEGKEAVASKFVEWISRKKDELEPPEPHSGEITGKYQAVYALYQKKLDEQNALDFGDLIMKTVRLLSEYPDLAEYYRTKKYSYLLVDEYQDTNTAQAVLLKLMAGDGKRLTVVGDPDQSIYSWRGANLNNLLHFEQSYPDAKLFKLEQNYRSAQTILDASNGLIRNNLKRREKNLWSDNPEGDKICYLKMSSDRRETEKLAQIICENNIEGIPYSDMAVFYRTHNLSRLVEEEFLKRGIPYAVVGGLPFYQRKEIKDLLCYVRFIINPADRVSLKRIINVPGRKIGEKTFARIESALQESGLDFYALFSKTDSVKGVSGHCTKVCSYFIYIIDKYRNKFASNAGWNEIMDELINEIGYMDYIKNTNTDEKADVRIANINTLIEAFAEYQSEHKGALIQEFIDTVALRSSVDDWNENQQKVSLMTLHCAKGLEFRVVYVIGLEEKLLPYYKDIEDPDEIEEERRLFYVGMTRAKEKAYLFSAQRRFTYTGSYYCLPSRFIREIPEDKIECLSAPPQTREFFTDENTQYYRQPNRYELNRFIDEFCVGDYVYHYQYGKGRILGGTGYGKNKRFIVQFNSEPEPVVVMASYAGLSKLDE